MNEIQPLTPNEDIPISIKDASSYSHAFINTCKHLFETKYPLVKHFRNKNKIMENEIITENKGIFNILYLPFDETRKDKQEQVKISNDIQGITIILKNDINNPEIAYELFEPDDGQPERKITTSKKNTCGAVYRASRLISELSALSDFDLVYTSLDDSK